MARNPSDQGGVPPGLPAAFRGRVSLQQHEMDSGRPAQHWPLPDMQGSPRRVAEAAVCADHRKSGTNAGRSGLGPRRAAARAERLETGPGTRVEVAAGRGGAVGVGRGREVAGAGAGLQVRDRGHIGGAGGAPGWMQWERTALRALWAGRGARSGRRRSRRMPSRASGTQRQERDWRNRRRQTRVRVSDAQICLTQVTTVCRTTMEPREMVDGARTTTR